MKKIISVLVIALLCVSFVIPVSADVSYRVLDQADLLTDSEEAKLGDKLDEMSERLETDIVVVSIETLEDYSIEEFASEFFEYCGYGLGEDGDGMLFAVAMEERKWTVYSSPTLYTKISDTAFDYIVKDIQDDLANGDYYECFNDVADKCDKVVTSINEGKTFREPFNFFVTLIVALVIGLIIAYIVASSMKSKLKSVHFKAEAADYLKQGSLNVTSSRDMFLYSHVTKTAKPKNNSSGSSSSSGGGYTGRSGSF